MVVGEGARVPPLVHAGDEGVAAFGAVIAVAGNMDLVPEVSLDKTQPFLSLVFYIHTYVHRFNTIIKTQLTSCAGRWSGRTARLPASFRRG